MSVCSGLMSGCLRNCRPDTLVYAQCIHKTENNSYKEINYLGSMNIDYGYVIYDFNRKKSLGVIHKFLDDNGIYYCGRFGEWAYLWIDQALISGRETAKKIIERAK